MFIKTKMNATALYISRSAQLNQKRKTVWLVPLKRNKKKVKELKENNKTPNVTYFILMFSPDVQV